MANEILKDEKLSEEQLEQVAGGNVSNTASDSQFLRDIGIPDIKGYGNFATNQRFDEIAGYVKDAWSKVGIKFTGNKDGDNVYELNDKKITRFEAYLYAQKQQKKSVNMASYDF